MHSCQYPNIMLTLNILKFPSSKNIFASLRMSYNNTWSLTWYCLYLLFLSDHAPNNLPFLWTSPLLQSDLFWYPNSSVKYRWLLDSSSLLQWRHDIWVGLSKGFWEESFPEVGCWNMDRWHGECARKIKKSQET